MQRARTGPPSHRSLSKGLPGSVETGVAVGLRNKEPCVRGQGRAEDFLRHERRRNEAEVGTGPQIREGWPSWSVSELVSPVALQGKARSGR